MNIDLTEPFYGLSDIEYTAKVQEIATHDKISFHQAMDVLHNGLLKTESIKQMERTKRAIEKDDEVYEKRWQQQQKELGL